MCPLWGPASTKYLNLDNNQISDFLALNRLTSLNRLSLNGNQITKIPDLSAMRSLEDIGLDQNQITAFEGFEGATVRNISLDGNNISEVLVKELPNLGHLQLRRNPLERLSFAEDQSIGALSVGETGFIDFESLSNISDTLGFIDAKGNSLDSAQVFAGFTQLYHLNIESNDISSIGSAFDAMASTKVYMNGNPLLCTEEQRLDSLTVNVYFNGQCTTDSDGDGSVDGRDAFPNITASWANGDGAPDDWNEGFSASDTTTGLILDTDDDDIGSRTVLMRFPMMPVRIKIQWRWSWGQ